MANLKNTEIDNNLELPAGTTGERPASPEEGQIRYNTDLETAEFYNSANWRPLSDTHAEATGGTVVDTDIGGVPYRIHYFTETGTDTLTVTNPGEVEYLIVGGGGAGGDTDAGGGGAGGLLTGFTTVAAQSYTITVGAGAPRQTSNDTAGENGENSDAFGLTAIGGGGGGCNINRVSDQPPGSGGSAGGNGSNTTSNPATFVSGQGNAGGVSDDGSGGGGGGGAGSAGSDGPTGNGGIGIASLISGSLTFYADGGGGGHGNPTFGGSGKGGKGFGSGDGTDAAPFSGSGGGGGGGGNGDGGAGGSGIVIIRYTRNSSLDTEPDRTVIATQPNNFSIIQDSLILNLDAGNTISNPGLESVWKNLGSSGNDATLNNGAAFGIGNINYVEFDGSNDYVFTTLDNPGGDWIHSICFWMYLERDQAQISSRIDPFQIGNNNSTSQYSAMDISSSTINWYFYGNDTRITQILFEARKWYHIGLTYTGGGANTTNKRFYLNGDYIPWDTSDGGDDLNIAANANCNIGRDGERNTAYFDGRINDFTVFSNRALDESQIIGIFNNTRYKYGI